MNELDLLVESAREQFAHSATPADLENAKAQFLGKAGRVTELMKGMAQLSVEEKKTRGAAINLAKQAIEAALNERRQALQDAQLQAVHGQIPLAVGEEDIGRLAAQFKGGRDKTLGGGQAHTTAYFRRAGEGQLGKALMLQHILTGFAAGAAWTAGCSALRFFSSSANKSNCIPGPVYSRIRKARLSVNSQASDHIEGRIYFTVTVMLPVFTAPIAEVLMPSIWFLNAFVFTEASIAPELKARLAAL